MRWRTLFRADGLDRLTADDIAVLRPFGLRTVIDLRRLHELETTGRFPVEDYPVTFHHLSVMDRTWDLDPMAGEAFAPGEFLHARYTEMLFESGPRYAEALRRLARSDTLPAVFHCAAGKDRTGLLAMLVLGALGVSHDDIVEDYALTAATMDAFLAARSENPQFAELIATVPVMFFSADPATMTHVLSDIASTHGSVRAYVRGLGITTDELASMESQLLTD